MKRSRADLIFIDVEATDNTPMTGEMTEFGAVHFLTHQSFHGVLWTHCVPDPANPARPVITPKSKRTDHSLLAVRFDEWLNKVSPGRKTMVSDNPAYDFMWIACFLDKELGRNPLGHSARRVGDFYAGLTQDWSSTSSWKKFRVTPHDHNPVHDAMGNAEAFQHILATYYTGD